MPSNRVLELRVYRIHHGRRDEFIARMRDRLVPLFKRHGIQIVHYGPSLHDEDRFILMRAYPSIAERQRVLDAVHGGAEWLVSHEEEVLGMIQSYETAVLEIDDWLIEALKERFESANRDRQLTGDAQ